MAETLVVGVDGGNSKTDLVLADASGRVLAQVRGAGTRPQQNGMSFTMSELVSLAGSALSQAGLAVDTPISVGAFYLANLDTPRAEAEAFALLDSSGVASRLVVRNDTFAVLGAGGASGGGVGVVGGAGINAVGIHPSGHTERFLAFGEHTGDWGGGRSLGMAALGAAIRAGDGRGPDTALRSAVAAHFGRSAPEDVAIAVEEGDIDWRDILGLTPVLYAVAVDGDPVAAGIVERMADEVAVMANALIKRLDLVGVPVPVVLGGGALQNAPDLLLDRVRALIAPPAHVEVLDAPPVVGPLVDALAMAGASPSTAALARAAVTGL